jgi:hypothetical protein
MVEFALGVFALALIVSAFILLGETIPRATHHLNLVRAKAGLDAQRAGGGETVAVPASACLHEALQKLGEAPAGLILRREAVQFDVPVGAFLKQVLFPGQTITLKEEAALPLMSLPPRMMQGLTP